jgi:hypothetical protein
MKITFNADGSVKSIENREFLIVGSNGVNLLQVYSLYPFADITQVTATINFRRADGFTITNVALSKAPVAAPDHFEVGLNYDSGILAVPGEIEMTVKLKGEGKTIANAVVCGHINRAIGKPDETSVLYYKVHALELQNADLLARIQVLEGGS